MSCHRERATLGSQEVLESLPVDVVIDDVPACIAARHDVIDGAFERDAESPGHRLIRWGRSRS
jgi:hypothetical protein